MSEWNYRLLRCEECGGGWVRPSPSQEVLSDIYADDFYTYQVVQPSLRGRLARAAKTGLAGMASARFGPGLSARAARVLTSIAEAAGARSVPLTASFPLALRRDAAILDFGCGSGWWLREMHRIGASNLWAYDVDQPRLPALGALGISVLVDPAPLPAGHFECIRLEGVLEHLLDPLDSLRRLRAALRPTGSVVLLVPDFDAWRDTGVRPEDAGLSLPAHLSHLNEEALRRPARLAGLRVVEVQRLPIWEIGRGALASANQGPAQLAPRGSGWLWRLRYHAWSRRLGRGDYMAARLVPEGAPGP